jgi:ribosomal protein S18 acetylase RimI-like enzyme
MKATISPVRLEAASIDAAGDALARAFFDYPLFVYAEPDDVRRASLLAWFMRAIAKRCVLFEEAHTTEGAPLGAALWVQPGHVAPTPEQAQAAGLDEMPSRFGEAAQARFRRCVGPLEELRAKHVPEPHWYLGILGVEPKEQGRGIGGALMAPVLARADADVIRCYLATHKEKNVLLYERHGFRVVVDDVVPDGGPRYWTMLREPARA